MGMQQYCPLFYHYCDDPDDVVLFHHPWVCSSTAHCSVTIVMTLMMWLCFITHGYAAVLPSVLSLLL